MSIYFIGGSNYKNNIWARGFAIAFVFAIAVFKTHNQSPEKTLNFVTFSEFLTHPRVHHTYSGYRVKSHSILMKSPNGVLDSIMTIHRYVTLAAHARVGWRTFFPVVLLCQFFGLAGNRFWFYILTYLEYNTVVALC